MRVLFSRRDSLPGLVVAAIVTSVGAAATSSSPVYALAQHAAPAISYAWPVAPSAPSLSGAPIGPDSGSDEIRGLQYRLIWTGLEVQPTGTWDEPTAVALKLFQKKYLFKLKAFAEADLVAKLVLVARDGSLDTRCLGPGITLCTDKTQRVTRYVKDGKVLMVVDTNFGPEKGDAKFGQYSRTREGVFHIFMKEPNSRSTLYGMVLPYYMGFDGGEGYHFSKYFSETGYKDTSMGCAIFNDLAKAKWIYKNTPMKTKVVIYH